MAAAISETRVALLAAVIEEEVDICSRAPESQAMICPGQSSASLLKMIVEAIEVVSSNEVISPVSRNPMSENPCSSMTARIAVAHIGYSGFCAPAPVGCMQSC